MSKKVLEHAAQPENIRRVIELEHEAYKAEYLERLRMQESLAQSGFRTLVLVNGGAIIALFSLIGSSSTLAQHITGARLWWSFGAFATGLFFTITAIACGYFMQIDYGNATVHQMWDKERELLGRPNSGAVDPLMDRAVKWEWAAVACFMFGLVGFLAGSALCFGAFMAMK